LFFVKGDTAPLSAAILKPKYSYFEP
jgi:hypothetical protein